MIPHERIEEAVRGAAGVDEHALVVTGFPDLRRGERLIVLLLRSGGKSPEEVSRSPDERSIPKLWIPAVKDYIKVEAIPRLGNGKVDLGQVRRYRPGSLLTAKSHHHHRHVRVDTPLILYELCPDQRERCLGLPHELINDFSFQVHEGLARPSQPNSS